MKKIGIFIVGIFLFIACSNPDAAFEAQLAEEGGSEDKIKLINKSSNCDSYTWYFGDGGTSAEENPVHTFKAFGNVMVVLEGRKGTSVDRDTNYIKIPEPPRKKVKISTDFGDMVFELFNTTPLHRDNFIKLASEGYYNDLLFHRVMDGFMVQGGDPDSRNATPDQMLGMGDPGYTVPEEYGERHYAGRLAGARNPNLSESSGSQFYIVEGKRYSSIELMNVASQYKLTYTEEEKNFYEQIGGTPFLDDQYTVFGQILEGFEVVDKISQVEVNRANRPLEDVKMQVSLLND